MFKTTRGRMSIAILLLLTSVSAAWASGATFAITGQGIALGEPKERIENGEEVPLYHAKAEVGKPFTLIARGMVLPRGGQAQPGEPDGGAWSYDAKAFKKLAAETKADKTRIVVRLEPTVAGTARIRFAGKILNYDRAFEVQVEVAAKP